MKDFHDTYFTKKIKHENVIKHKSVGNKHEKTLYLGITHFFYEQPKILYQKPISLKFGQTW